jgi:hypothetical protein
MRILCWAMRPVRGAMTATEIFFVVILGDVVGVLIWLGFHENKIVEERQLGERERRSLPSSAPALTSDSGSEHPLSGC